MGKSSAQTVGYWYLPAFHAGLGIGPFDAFLQFRGGDKPAWVGEITASGSISINVPNLWGGEKDQGGIVGDVDIMFGEAGQQPNAYLASVFGSQQSAWRGLATLVFKGGKYGAMNPYPQKASYKIRKIKKGWDNDVCWYEAKAEIMLGATFANEDPDWKYLVTAPAQQAWEGPAAPGFDDSAWETGAGGFGSGGPGAGLGVGTYIPSGTIGKGIWIRRRFNAVAESPISFDVWHDDGAALWLNGEPIELIPTENYFHSTAVAPAYLVQSENVVALKVLDSIPTGSPTAIYAGLDIAQDIFPLRAMNPAHILYYSITQSDMGREPTSSINDASFQAAADWYFNERFGLCTSYDPTGESVEEFQQRICRVAGCSLTRSLIDGQWYIDIANGEYDLESLPVLTDDDILEFEEQPTLLDSAVNSVSVKYFDPELKEEITTPPVQAPALIADFGTNHITIEYLEIPNAALALRVSQRELLARITPLRGFPLKTTRKPYSWRPSTYFRLQVPKRGISNMVCIFSEKSSGQLRSGAMTISATQDIYSVPASAFVDIEHGVDTRPSQVPQPITVQRAFEAPHIDVVGALSTADMDALDDDASFLLAVAVDPATSRDYTLLTAPSAGSYTERANGDWCPSALVVEAADRTTTAFTISSGKRLAEVEIGSAALWGDEIVRVDGLDATAGTITLGRGCADTVPTEHAAGTRIWFYQAGASADATEYTAAESIDVKLLTNTGSAQLAAGSATSMTVTFVGRRMLPYPPAKVKINGTDWPTTVSGEFAVTWAHRNRVSQADQLIDTTVASITPVDNTRYGLRFKRADTSAVLVERSDIGPGTATVTLSYTGDVVMESWTIDDHGASLQKHVYAFAYTPPGGSPTDTITATAYTPVYGGTIIDGGDLDG